MNLRAVLVLAGTLVAAGCAVHVSGSPTAGEAPTSSTTSAPKFAELLPPRPRELNLADVDPCKDLLTYQQLRELDYDLGYARPGMPDNSDIHGGPDCTFSSNGGAGGRGRNIRALVGISTTEGALTWVTDPTREPDTRPEVITVQGFSALVLPSRLFPDHCRIVVDTAEGQYLDVYVSPATGEFPDVKPYCDEAARVADMAIQTISTSR